MVNKVNVNFLLLIGTICLTNICSYGQINNIAEIRNKIFYTDFDLNKSRQLITDINSLDLTDPIIKAYTGASEMLVAKYSWNPISKITFLKGGLKNINEAVSSDIENIEIRFLRFYIENSLPKYLGLSDHLTIDKKIILNHLNNLSSLGLTKDIALYINGYMIDHGRCTSAEVGKINQSIAQLHFDKQ